MERRHRSSNVGISFISADHEGPGFGNREIASCHRCSRSQESRTSVIANDLRQEVGIIVVWIGTNRAREQLCHVLPRLVDSGEHDVTGWLTIELLDSFTQIRFDDLDSTVLQEGSHMTLFLEHRLALDHLLNAVIFEDG